MSDVCTAKKLLAPQIAATSKASAEQWPRIRALAETSPERRQMLAELDKASAIYHAERC